MAEGEKMAKKRKKQRGDRVGDDVGGEKRVGSGARANSAPTPPSASKGMSLRAKVWGGLAILVGLTVAGLLFSVRLSNREAREQRCSTARADIERKLRGNDLAAIEAYLNEARSSCQPEQQPEVERLAGQVTEKQQAARQAARQAAADDERAAVDLWPERANHAEKWVKEGEEAAAEGRWPDVSVAALRAESVLEGFKGTSVEQSPRWVDLAGRVAELRKKVAAQGAKDSAAVERDRAAIQEAIRQLREEEGRKGGR